MKKINKRDQFFLEGNKVFLRAFEEQDGKYLKIWLNNKKINYFLEIQSSAVFQHA